MLRVALVGPGSIGAVHAENLRRHPEIDFTTVLGVNEERVESFASRYGAHGTTDETQVFDPDRIDAVLVASPTGTHASYLRLAADASQAVFLEKPIDLDLGRAEEAARYAQSRETRAMIDFNRRFDRSYVELQHAVSSGEIGTVELIQLTSRGPSLAPLSYLATSGGQMRDQTIHFFDLARWISGQDPTQVYAVGSALAEPGLSTYGDVDTSVATLQLPSGAMVQIDCARRTNYGYDEKIEVHGSAGMIEARRQRSGSVSRYSPNKITDNGLHASWFERIKPTYATALDNFVQSIKDDRPPTPSLDDGLKAQAIAEAATLSLTSQHAEQIAYLTL